MLKNPVSNLLPIAMAVSYLWKLWPIDCANIECHKIVHWSGREGFVEVWHYWIVSMFACFLIVIFSMLFFDKSNKVERDSVIAFGIWVMLELLAYMWNGWPSSLQAFIYGNRINLNVVGYALTILAFTGIRRYKYGSG